MARACKSSIQKLRIEKVVSLRPGYILKAYLIFLKNSILAQLMHEFDSVFVKFQLGPLQLILQLV